MYKFLKKLGYRKLTRSKFHTEYPQYSAQRCKIICHDIGAFAWYTPRAKQLHDAR